MTARDQEERPNKLVEVALSPETRDCRGPEFERTAIVNVAGLGRLGRVVNVIRGGRLARLNVTQAFTH